MMTPITWLFALWTLLAAQLPAGQIVDTVACAADPSQSYALYVPAGYTASRAWPVIFAFDPGGRGRNPVERYQAAAEQYGFIVAGSNNSRNGSPEFGKAVDAMTADVGARFNIDPKRIYLAGMSGGSRVALFVALASTNVAGVIASSAGYPDSRPRKTLPFPIFGTAGTEDFNHLEMRQLDRALTTPHHLAIFEGGHTWLSSALAVEAVEWMEVQAMKAGRKPRDEQEIDRLFAKRAAAAGGKADKDAFLAAQSMVDDFKGLRDVTSLEARATELGRDSSIRAALKKDRDDDDREEGLLREITSAGARLATEDERADALAELRQRWKTLSDQAKQKDDSAQRRLARRVLGSLGASAITKDPDYLKIIAQYRIGRGAGPNR
jgi:poly(3-hydroxybutyrate) depolymerase